MCSHSWAKTLSSVSSGEKLSRSLATLDAINELPKLEGFLLWDMLIACTVSPWPSQCYPVSISAQKTESKKLFCSVLGIWFLLYVFCCYCSCQYMQGYFKTHGKQKCVNVFVLAQKQMNLMQVTSWKFMGRIDNDKAMCEPDCKKNPQGPALRCSRGNACIEQKNNSVSPSYFTCSPASY